MESEVKSTVTLAIVIMTLVLVAVGCITGCLALYLSSSITTPVNRLIGVVNALNRMDFSEQASLRVCFLIPVHIL